MKRNVYSQCSQPIASDLKPSNIGFDEEGKVKIFDFGLAREFVAGSPMKKPRLMTGGTGTPRYMAPEVAKMEKSYGLPADVYSFSILLWQIVTKRTPYGQISSPTEFAAKVVKGNLRPNLAHVESESIRNILENGWSADPGARPTFSHMREMLEDYLRDMQQTPMQERRCWSWSLSRSGHDQACRRNPGRYDENVRSAQPKRCVCVVPNDAVDVGCNQKPCQRSNCDDDPVTSSIMNLRRHRFRNRETCASTVSDVLVDQEQEDDRDRASNTSTKTCLMGELECSWSQL